MSSFLVTGADGQLGQCFRAVASEFPNHHLIFANRQEVDLARPETLHGFFDTNPFSVIINCAAYTQVDQAEGEYEKAYQINAKGVQNLVNFAEEKELSLIHFSTDYVFSGNASVPFQEDDKCNPINAYGQSKYEGEQRMDKAMCPHTTFRISWLFSPFGTNFVKTILRLYNSKDQLNIVHDQWGRPTYGMDLARVVLTHIDQPIFFHYSFYHFAQRGSTNWFDFAKKIQALTKSTCKLVPITSDDYPTTAKRPLYAVLDTTRIENHLSLQPFRWEVALEDCLKRIKAE
ncbi:dTDP-4-dehydrorhamnose reductase [Flavobacteriaceae bacterium]|nr:dTDP-4-dehydrorhamnose reductase [Flavobacteriaceae bacterium]